MAAITLRVNGGTHTVDVDPSTPLLYVLRNDLGLQGPRFGCGLGQCGACTVIINGAAVRSCITPVSAVKGEITTLEGLAEERHAASAAAGLDRRAGAAVRLLPERADHDRQGAARPQSESDRRQIREGMDRRAVPLHDVLPHPGRHQARREVDARPRRRRARRWSHDAPSRNIPKQIEDAARAVATRRPRAATSSRLGPAGRQLRRRALRGRSARRRSAEPLRRRGPYPDPDFRQLDSWIVIHRGQHRDVLRRQDGLRPGHRHRLPADDVRRTRHRLRQDQPASWAAPTSPSIRADRAVRMRIQTDGWPMRRVAAEARRVLLELASARFGVPVDQLAVSDGVITVESRSVEEASPTAS